MMQRSIRSVVRALGPLHKAGPVAPYQLWLVLSSCPVYTADHLSFYVGAIE